MMNIGDNEISLWIENNWTGIDKQFGSFTLFHFGIEWTQKWEREDEGKEIDITLNILNFEMHIVLYLYGIVIERRQNDKKMFSM